VTDWEERRCNNEEYEETINIKAGKPVQVEPKKQLC